jgi:hypothetical protein
MKTYVIKYERELYYEAENDDEALEMAKKELEEEAAFHGLDISNFIVLY